MERRGFRDGVDLHFGAIDTTNVNRKRGKDRETIRKVPKQFKYNKYIEKESTYAWEMHEHLTCKRNCIMGSAQSNPTSTQSIAHI